MMKFYNIISIGKNDLTINKETKSLGMHWKKEYQSTNAAFRPS
jgi:hypothetical protein